MAETAYIKLFNTIVAHNFYSDHISKKDLAVKPTSEASAIMKNNNMLFRNDESGFRVLYRTLNNTTNPFVNFSNLRLTFSIEQMNVSEFLNFSDLNDGANLYEAGKILYFTNDGTETTNDLTYDLLDFLRPSVFTYKFPQTVGSVGHIKIMKGVDDVTPVYPDPNTIPADADNNFFYPIDFTEMPKGVYEFETWGSGVHTTKTVYIDNDLAGKGVFGIVDIKVLSAASGSFPPVPAPPPPYPEITDSRVYVMRFVRRESFWKYVVVMKSGKTLIGDTINIIDPNVIPPAPYTQLTFTRKADTKVNNIDAAVFTSFPGIYPAAPGASPIPFFQVPIKGLKIEKNVALPTPHIETVVTDIATPSIGLVSGAGTNASPTEIFVFI